MYEKTIVLKSLDARPVQALLCRAENHQQQL